MNNSLEIFNFETYCSVSSISNNEEVMLATITWIDNDKHEFGEITLINRENIKTKKKSLEIDTWGMGKDFAKELFCQLIDGAEEIGW